MARAQLLEAYVELQTALKASEDWEASYRKSPDTFKKLIREEAKLQADTLAYFVGLAERIPQIVNWPDVKLQPIQAAAVPPESDEVFKRELALLAAALGSHILTATTLGAQAGEIIYKRPIGINSLTDFILDSAEHHTAELVSQVNSTTRKLIQRAIKRSIAEGRDMDGTLELLRETAANPVRAEMIASTESVNAYQSGLERFAAETGAKSRQWEALTGACKLCGPMHGQVKKVGSLFTLPNGKQVSRPAAHPRCRCGLIYNY